MNNIIFDASALLALIKNETINIELAKFLGSVYMSSVNVSEVARILLKSEMSLHECKDAIESLINSIIDFNQEQSFLAAYIKSKPTT
ncbi:MAG: PIN domain-containing protein [Rickettsia endosymbiont of Ixodes persulcatus]|nr:PIN domain-containing protein [Rickettsia endosymbiont of Ixodes persulcatus]MCZ6903997.1 PIN domain-containing protein [Rickettsia endosymbiont of Ixodes persulcatus]MCZ6909325.1 PIN domain-containing protein [Rickettsia endosymbiont of Ixodes persulcatus]MCZ6910597.1 PIN domain-containing protein [Rickettsia endosymbiont of Ixodes persulcatus]MCZ6913091.1 PIN domain-containing protein [Rickettsia endosymbiont of Ixodes persulcatus]